MWKKYEKTTNKQVKSLQIYKGRKKKYKKKEEEVERQRQKR